MKTTSGILLVFVVSNIAEKIKDLDDNFFPINLDQLNDIQHLPTKFSHVAHVGVSSDKCQDWKTRCFDWLRCVDHCYVFMPKWEEYAEDGFGTEAVFNPCIEMEIHCYGISNEGLGVLGYKYNFI